MKAPRRCGCDVGSIPNEDAEVSGKRNSIRNAGRGRQSRDRASGKPDVMRLPMTEIVFRRIEFAVKTKWSSVRNAHRTIDVKRFCSKRETP